MIPHLPDWAITTYLIIGAIIFILAVYDAFFRKEHHKVHVEKPKKAMHRAHKEPKIVHVEEHNKEEVTEQKQEAVAEEPGEQLIVNH